MLHNKVLLHLSLIDGIGSGTIQKIVSLQSQVKSWQDYYEYTMHDWYKLGIHSVMASLLVDGLRDRSLLEKELALIEQHAINWITITDAEYPEVLRHISHPPPVLYWRGASLFGQRALALVGSRKANEYAAHVIQHLVAPLVGHSYVIVSGGAIGADAMAHQATLDCHGKTIVVLGSGLLKPYPAANYRLFEDVISYGGMIVSSFALTHRAHKGSFPARNRIIAGLSQGVIVIQAGIKSGARITADFALEQGRDVFAVPGSIYDPLSAGCHALIKEGACIVNDANSILNEYGVQESVQQLYITQQIDGTIPVPSEIPSLVQKIKNICVLPQSLDELMIALSMPLDELQMLLVELEMDHHVTQDFNGLWKSI